MKSKKLKSLKVFGFYIVGSIIYTSSVSMFLSPNQITPGGITGIATAINYSFSIPSGLLLLLFNFPILIIGFLKFGGTFVLKTTFVTIITSISLTLTDALLPSFYIDKILASVFGGTLMGIGLSLIMLKGATTGGIDIIAKLINRRFRHFTVGKIILLLDAFIIAFAALVYKNIETALYSIISMYACTKIMDLILYGSDTGKLIYIVTDCEEDVCREININLKRGVTVLSAKGSYTGNIHSLLLCTVRRYEVSAVYDILDRLDRNAFIVVSDAGEIIGEGFKALN